MMMLPIALVISIALAAGEAPPEPQWTWEAPVTLPAEHPDFLRLEVPPGVFDVGQARLTDLRLLDETGQYVPHLIEWGPVDRIEEVAWRPVDIINRTFEPGTFASIVLDFSGQVRKNRVRLALSGENYRRRALIEGSVDGQFWEVVAENRWLFDIAIEGHEATVDTLEFPVNDFRYLRITVYNMPDDPRRIDIEGAEAALRETVAEPAVVDVPIDVGPVETDALANYTTVQFDVGHRHLPVTRLAFEIADPHFYRSYELAGRNEERVTVHRPSETGPTPVERDAPWEPIRSGILYRIEDTEGVQESTVIDLPSAPYRFFRLRIYNGDDAPLTFTGASAQRRQVHIVFRPGDAQAVRMVGGDPKIGPPNYDLARSVANLRQRDLATAEVGEIVRLEVPDTRPWTARFGWLLTVALIAAVAAFAALIGKNLKHLRQDTPGASEP